MADASGSSHWKYDERGRVISETRRIDTATYWTQWTYDPQDRVLTQAYPGGNAGQAGEVVTTAYGRWGHPATLTGAPNRKAAEGLAATYGLAPSGASCRGSFRTARYEAPGVAPGAGGDGRAITVRPRPSAPRQQSSLRQTLRSQHRAKRSSVQRTPWPLECQPHMGNLLFGTGKVPPPHRVCSTVDATEGRGGGYARQVSACAVTHRRGAPEGWPEAPQGSRGRRVLPQHSSPRSRCPAAPGYGRGGRSTPRPSGRGSPV